MMSESKTIYRVVSSPWEEDTPFPWDYEEEGLVRWVDEVFMEGLDLLDANGYRVEEINA